MNSATMGPATSWKTWLVLGTWLASAAAGFWAFEARDIRAFVPAAQGAGDWERQRYSAALWFGNAFGPAKPGAATLVNVTQPGCRCNRWNEQHVERLRDRFAARGVRFASVQLAAAPAWLALAPAALVFDGDGRLLYAGPYDDSPFCGSGPDRIAPILAAALAGTARPTPPAPASACACPLRTLPT